MEDIHKYIINNPQFRKETSCKSEQDIQREIRPLIIHFLEHYFEKLGYVDWVSKANRAFYWEGQEQCYDRDRTILFASKNYPDFVIKEPYSIAIEYKKSDSGSLMKRAIGQSIVHTLSGEYDFVYLLFHDQNKDKRIKKSLENELEKRILNEVWKDFNVLVKVV